MGQSGAMIGWAALACLALSWGAWAQELPVTRIAQIYGMATDPTGAARLFLATERGFFATRPDGLAEHLSAGTQPFTGFAADPRQTGVFYAAGPATGGEDATFIRSNDFGRTWEAVATAGPPPPAFLALDIFDADPALMAGAAGALYRSADSGITWQAAAGALPGQVADLAIAPRRPETIFAGTTGGLFVTEDGGDSWRAALAEGRPASLVEILPDGRAFAFIVGEGLFVGGDAGQAWILVAPASAFDGALLHLAGDFGGNLFAVTQFMKLLVSHDGGRTWQPFNP